MKYANFVALYNAHSFEAKFLRAVGTALFFWNFFNITDHTRSLKSYKKEF